MDGWMAKVAHLTRRKHFFFFFFPNQQLTPSLEPILGGTDHVTWEREELVKLIGTQIPGVARCRWTVIME